jgi:hypothetical protein
VSTKAGSVPMVGAHETRRLDFTSVTDKAGRHLRAYLFDLAELDTSERRPHPARFYQAVSFLRVHEIKKHYRQLKSLEELADDAVSACYDPGDGDGRIFGVYALGNILEPRVGLMQLYGARGFGATPEEAIDHAERDARALRGLLEGKFRQMVLSPLTVEESGVFYDHLARLGNAAVVQGIPVRRVPEGHADPDLYVRYGAQQQYEQLEVIAAALADVPFQMMTWFDPLTFEEITWMVSLTAQELSKWASEVKGSKSISLAAAIQSPFHPSAEYLETLGRETGGSRMASAEHVQQLADLRRLRQEQLATESDLQRHSEMAYTRSDHVVTDEAATLHEEGTAHVAEVGREQLDRASDLDWSSNVGRTVAESGVIRVSGTRAQAQQGYTSEAQRLTETERAQEDVHSESDAAFARQTHAEERIYEQQAGREHRDVVDRYAWGEDYGGRESGTLDGVRAAEGSSLDRQVTTREGDMAFAQREQGRSTDDVSGIQRDRTEGSGTQSTLYSDYRQETVAGETSFQGAQAGDTRYNGIERIDAESRQAVDERTPVGQPNHVYRVEHETERGYQASPQALGIGFGQDEGIGVQDTYEVRDTNLERGSEEHSTEVTVGGQEIERSSQGWETYDGDRAQDISGARQEARTYDGSQLVRTDGLQTVAHTAAENGERSVSETVDATVQRNWGSQEAYGDAWARSYGGYRDASGVRSDSIDASYAREAQTGRVTDAAVAGTEQRMEDVARDMVRESETDRGIQRGWQAGIGEREVSTRQWAGVTSQDIAETGHTASRLQQVTNWQKELDQAFTRDVASRRRSDLTSQAEGSAIDDLAAQESVVAGSRASGQEYSDATVDGQGQLLRLVDGFTRGSQLTSGFRMGSAPFMTASMGRSVQTYDAEKDLIVQLLGKQLERLKASQDAGLFHTNWWLAAYTDEDMERMSRAVTSAMREENVVSPVQVRTFPDAARQVDLIQHLRNLHPCPEREQVGIWQLGVTSELLTSNDLGAIVHPLRVDGHGGVSTTVEALPAGLRVPADMRGETWWGQIISPTTGRITANQFRVSGKMLMHLTCVGGSGSGKSNGAQVILSEIMNRLRVDERGNEIPVQMRQLAHDAWAPEGTARPGKPQLGATVFDPGGDWRKLLLMVDPRDCSFYSLTNPHFRPLHINPLRIPSPHIRPTRWAELVAKRWALSYATGATGYHAIKSAILALYRSRGVYDPKTGHTDVEASRHVRMHHLYDYLSAAREDKSQKRSRQDISVGVIDRILEKLEAFTPEMAGEEYMMYDAHEGTTVEVWMPEHHLTILEGAFEDDNLKSFIIGLMAHACYLHARGRYEAHGNDTYAFVPHILVFEEAHEVMEAQEERSQTQAAVETGSSLWNKMTDQGRKYGLHVWSVGQRLKALPEGFLSSSRITILMGLDDADDIKLAVTKVGKVTTGMSEDLPWMRLPQRLEVGWAVVKFSRMAELKEMEPVLIKFHFADADPPSNAEISFLLSTASHYVLAQDAQARRAVLSANPAPVGGQG